MSLDGYIADNDIQDALELSIYGAMPLWRNLVLVAQRGGLMIPDRVLAGIDIGGTKTAIVISKGLPSILAKVSFATSPELGPSFAIGKMIQGLHELLDSQSLHIADLHSIGISCGGPLDLRRGIIQAPPNLSTWQDVPICDLLKQEFGVDCFLENDANAGALAEVRFGAGRGCSNVVFLTLGTGLGAGFILNGQLYRGASDAAGEIGHVRLTARGPKGFGKAGSAEGWASGGGMAQVARSYAMAAIRAGETTLLMDASEDGSRKITGIDVAEAAKKGDRVAQAVVRKVGERLGESMAILIDLLNPECIAVGGLALRFGESLLGPAREVVREEALTGSVEQCRIVQAELGEGVGDVAALCAASAYPNVNSL